MADGIRKDSLSTQKALKNIQNDSVLKLNQLLVLPTFYFDLRCADAVKPHLASCILPRPPRRRSSSSSSPATLLLLLLLLLPLLPAPAPPPDPLSSALHYIVEKYRTALPQSGNNPLSSSKTQVHQPHLQPLPPNRLRLPWLLLTATASFSSIAAF